MNAQLQPQRGRVIYDEPAEIYYRRSLHEANNTGLKILDSRSPAHFKHWVENPDDEKETAGKTFGKAFHCAMLEPEVFANTYSVLPANAPARPTDAMRNAKNPSASSIERVQWWDDWTAANAGKVLLSAADYDRAQRMADSVRRQPIRIPLDDGGEVRLTVADFIDASQTEVTLRWTDPATGVECKARLDLLSVELGIALDPKSTVDASAEAFARAMASYRYHQQDAMYTDGAEQCGIHLRAPLIFLAVESEEPHIARPVRLNPVARERGLELRNRAIARHAECLRTGLWPGYTDTIDEIALPAWAFYD